MVRDAWIQREFKRCLAEFWPAGWERAKASKVWCYRFCKRYDITDQAKTNKKKLPVAERLPAIQHFHSWILYEMLPWWNQMPKVWPLHWTSHVSLRPNPFVETGFLLVRDGSENHLIKMAGVDDYIVPSPENMWIKDCIMLKTVGEQ
jgi:hypothetical protein